MVIPKWLEKYISQHDLELLEKKIARIEEASDVEIVPVIVRASSPYPQARITLALVMIAVLMELWHLFGLHWHWDGFTYALLFTVTSLALVFFVAPMLARWGWLQMVLTHKNEEQEQCWKRSEIEFYSGRVSRTKRDNGILLYVSLLEHRVIVKGDSSIYKKLDAKVWDEAVQKIIAGIRKKQMAQGFENALDDMGSLLKEHFPVPSGKHNEVPNTFIIKE
jgi:putative membrane protein